MTVKDRYEGFQDVAKDLWECGCHFLVLLSIAEEESGTKIDLIECIRLCRSKGWIRSDFYVNDALAILRFYTHKEWKRSDILQKLPKVIADNQYTEVIYYNARTSFQHFRRRGFDTKNDSVTVREGKIIGYYIYTVTR